MAKRRRALGHWPTIDEQEEVFGSRAFAAIQILRGAASYVGIAGEQPEAPAYVDPEALRHQAAYQERRRQARERRAARLERERQAQERRAAVHRERAAIMARAGFRFHTSGPGTGVPRDDEHDGQPSKTQIFQIEILREGIWYRDSVGYSSLWAAQQALARLIRA